MVMSHSNPNEDPPLDDDLPPPYYSTEASSSTAQQPPAHLTPITPTSQSSLFASHLTSLRSQILSERAARSCARDQHDSFVLALLVPEVEVLLASIATIHPPPRLVETTIVPAATVGLAWEFSDHDEGRPGEVRRVLRLEQGGGGSKLAMDRKGGSVDDNKTMARSKEGLDDRSGWKDEAGSSDAQSTSALWWADESMARRLAKHLQPDRPTASVDRQIVKAHVAQNKEAQKSSRWSLFRKNGPTPQPEQKASEMGASTGNSSRTAMAEDVTMSVKAEEVTFRRENAMGIWETSTGWGIVVRVRIRHA